MGYNNTGDTQYILHILVVPNTEAALPCWSAMDTLREGLAVMCNGLLMPCQYQRTKQPRAPEASIAIEIK